LKSEAKVLEVLERLPLLGTGASELLARTRCPQSAKAFVDMGVALP